jgi:hypothetical protein
MKVMAHRNGFGFYLAGVAAQAYNHSTWEAKEEEWKSKNSLRFVGISGPTQTT